MKVLSIIIPIYNGEIYLKDLLEDILKNLNETIEIVLVNDGSKDMSLEICKRYEAIDKRIKVIDQDNIGPGGARNTGLKNSNGEYITFLDVDDRVEYGYIDEIINNITSNDIDVFCFGYISILKNKTKNILLPKKDILNKQEIDNKILDIVNSGYFNPVWNKIYKSAILKDNNIKFTEEYNLGEDFVFNLDVMKYVTNIKFINKAFLSYYDNDDSLTKNYHSDRFDNFIFMNQRYFDFLELKGIDYTFLYTKIVKDVFSSFMHLYHKDCDKTKKEKKQYIKDILDIEIVRKSLVNANPSLFRYKILHKILKMKNINLILLFSKILYTIRYSILS